MLTLHSTDRTVTQARQTCCRVLIQEHTDRICEDVDSFLTNNQTEDLHRLFSLFSELPKESALVSLKVRESIARDTIDLLLKRGRWCCHVRIF